MIMMMMAAIIVRDAKAEIENKDEFDELLMVIMMMIAAIIVRDAKAGKEQKQL